MLFIFYSMPKRGFSFEIRISLILVRLDEKEKNIVSIAIQSKDRLKQIFRIKFKFVMYTNFCTTSTTFKLLLVLFYFYTRVKVVLYFSLLIFD